jgi:RNA polymerase sigma-B factor
VRGSFTAYAVVTIRGEIKRHFRDHTWRVHVPRRLQDLGVGVNRATSALTGELARSPTEAEIAERLDASVADVRETIRSVVGYRPASLSAPIGDGTSALGDLCGEPDGDLESVTDRLCLTRLLDCLPERERRLLALRFHGNMTQAEIAAELGISQMHVSRLLSHTLAWLRQAMMADVPSAWPAGASDRHHLKIAVERHAAAPSYGSPARLTVTMPISSCMPWSAPRRRPGRSWSTSTWPASRWSTRPGWPPLRRAPTKPAEQGWRSG